ncbi:hypothetical protein R4369_33905 [Rhodococcus opacus]|nr:hypothetical protein [Rhodococcus opacus]MDV7089132.1 hypothetical protein [Rhodococcus opacus]
MRHTWTTELANAGMSLQALMALPALCGRSCQGDHVRRRTGRAR